MDQDTIYQSSPLCVMEFSGRLPFSCLPFSVFLPSTVSDTVGSEKDFASNCMGDLAVI